MHAHQWLSPQCEYEHIHTHPRYEQVLMSISEMVQQLHVQDASFLTIITKRYLQIG